MATRVSQPQPGDKIVTCRKCKGTGNLPNLYFSDWGRCWKCDGSGKINVTRDARVTAATAQAETLPTMHELIDLAKATGLRYRKAQELARSYQRALLNDIYGESTNQADYELSDEDLELAINIFEGVG